MQEHIKRLAVEAGIDDSAPLTPYMLQRLEVFAQAVARECADIARETVCDTHIPTGIKIYGTTAYKAIRARFGLASTAEGG